MFGSPSFCFLFSNVENCFLKVVFETNCQGQFYPFFVWHLFSHIVVFLFPFALFHFFFPSISLIEKKKNHNHPTLVANMHGPTRFHFLQNGIELFLFLFFF